MTAQDYMAPESVGRLEQRALGAGIAGLVACGICYFVYREQYADQLPSCLFSDYRWARSAC